MYSVKITGAAKLIVQSDNSEMLAVDFDVIKDDTVAVHYSHGFPLETTPEDITAYLKDFLANYIANAERAVENADRDAVLAVADATITAVIGVEITN